MKRQVDEIKEMFKEAVKEDKAGFHGRIYDLFKPIINLVEQQDGLIDRLSSEIKDLRVIVKKLKGAKNGQEK